MIYLTYWSANQIVQTDLDFNIIKQSGSKDNGKDWVYQEWCPLNFKPRNIKIIKNVAIYINFLLL